MKYLRITSFLILASVVIFSCVPNVAELNIGLITGKPCAPPCWQKLTPGMSTREDVEWFIKGLNPDEWPERDERVSDMGCTVISIRDQSGIEVNRLVNFFVDQNQLILIQSDINQTLTLGTIAKRFGEPEYYRATNAVGLDGSSNYSASVYYPDFGLKLSLAVNENAMERILPTMEVLIAEYYPTGDMQDYFFNDHLCWSEPEEIQKVIDYEMKFIQPWTGFGDIQVIETR